MRHSIPASVAVFSLLLFVAHAQAQSNGAPPTSPVVGGHPVNVAPFTGTVGTKQPTTNTHVTFSTSTSSKSTADDHHHRHHNDAVALYPVLVPYAAEATDQSNDQNPDADSRDSDDDDQGGPTVFDRRGSGADSYIPPVHYTPAPRPAQNQDSDPPAPPPVQTLLVFKDGHKLEVGNYAIVGATLFDLTPGHPRHVQLADLDLSSTQKQNDDRGVNFQLPQLPQGN